MRRCCKGIWAASLVVALLLPALYHAAGAQSSDDGASPPPALPVSAATPAPAEGDRAEVATIVMHSVSEVKLCGLATQKSQDDDVRALCRKAAADSARAAIAGMQLEQKLGARGLKLQSSPETPATLDSLAQYSGEEFDRKFLLSQIEAGAADEHAIRYAEEVASDDAVKNYENDVLPKIEDRLQLAEGALRRISETQP